MILYPDCDYYKDLRDEEVAPSMCDECYRWEICSKAYMKDKTFIPIEDLQKFKGKQVWVQTPGIPQYGRVATIEDVNQDKKILWLVDDFTCHDYGNIWVAYPMENDKPVSYRKGDHTKWKKKMVSCRWEYSVKQ